LNTNENIKKTDPSIEHAKMRTYLASENTMMAWVRTSLTLIGFGVGIFEVIDKTEGKNTFRSSRLVALSMVLLGVAALVVAIKMTKQNKKDLSQEHFEFKNRKSTAVKVGYALIVIGIFGIIEIVINLLS
jgi:putative membrane protein